MKIQTIAVLVDLENPMEWLFTFFVLFCFFGLLGGSNSLNQVIFMNNIKTTTTTKKTLKEHQTHTDKNRKKKRGNRKI